MIDVEQAKLDPTSIFAHPRDVLANQALSREDKIDILRRWAYDARELEVADEENMGGAKAGASLDEILKCLNQLGAGLLND
jgi:hypothetical protein